MSLTVTDEYAAIDTVIARFLAADGVTGTVLGTARRSLADGAWAAFADGRLALRPADTHQLLVMGSWTAEQCHELAGLVHELPALAGLSGAPDVVAALTAMVRPGTPIAMGQRLYRCDNLIPPVGVAGSASAADHDDLQLLTDWFVRFADESGGVGASPGRAAERALRVGTCHLWLGPSGEPVSLAVRQPPAAGSARIGPVYTPPTHRGHGYGSAVTAAATSAILATGDVPVLSPTSRTRRRTRSTPSSAIEESRTASW